MTEDSAVERLLRHQALPIRSELFLLAAAVVCIMAPGTVLKDLGLPGGIGLAGVATMLSTALLGWRLGVVSALTLSFGLVIADAAAPYWITATVVMVVVSVLYGLSSLKGWQYGLLLTAIQFTLVTANPPTRDLTLTDPVSLLEMFLVTAATTAFGLAAVLLVTRGRALSRDVPVDKDRAIPYAVMLGVAAVITTSIALLGDFKGWSFKAAATLMMTPIIVLQPRLAHGMIGRVLDRSWGVIAGTLLALGVSVALVSTWSINLMAGVAAALALFARDARWGYRRYVEAITAAVILTSGSRAVILADGRAHIVATLLGLAIAAGLAALALPFLRRARRDESPSTTTSTNGTSTTEPATTEPATTDTSPTGTSPTAT